MKCAARQAAPTHPARGKMIAAIHIQWHQLRPDLHLDPECEREERLQFITDALKLKHPLRSMRTLSDSQLGRVLDALRQKQSQPALAGYTPPVKTAPSLKEPAKIIHFASPEQIYTLDKLFVALKWTDEFRKHFLKERYMRESPAHISPKQAHSLIRILLNILCSREIKARGETASREKIRAEIPLIKARLDIDRGLQKEPTTT